MPGKDKTGPLGMGPMTGRGAGLCAGYPAPGYRSAGGGLGRGRGLERRPFADGAPAAVYGIRKGYTGTGEAPADEQEILRPTGGVSAKAGLRISRSVFPACRNRR